MQSSPHLWVRASCPLPSFSTCEFSRFGTKRTKANALISICLFFIASAILFHRHSFFVSFIGAKLVFFCYFSKKHVLFLSFFCAPFSIAVAGRMLTASLAAYGLFPLNICCGCKQGFFMKQTRLPCTAKRTCLRCKEGLFAYGAYVCCGSAG